MPRTDAEILDFLLKERMQSREEVSADMDAAYDPTFGDDRKCQCGHPYYRHYDTYDGMREVGCKYCECARFVPPAAPNDAPEPDGAQ